MVKEKKHLELLYLNLSDHLFQRSREKTFIRLLLLLIVLTFAEMVGFYSFFSIKYMKSISSSQNSIVTSTDTIESVQEPLLKEIKSLQQSESSLSMENNSVVLEKILQMPRYTMTEQLNCIDQVIGSSNGVVVENISVDNQEIVLILSTPSLSSLHEVMKQLGKYFTTILPLSVKSGEAKIVLQGYEND